MASPSSDARSQRIINHMNKEHRDSLALYLRHLNKVPASSADTAELLDVSLNQLRIRTASDGREHTVSLDPPLSSWEKMRPRLVEMDTVAREGLGIPREGDDESIVITEYEPPMGFALVVFCAVCFYFVCFVSLPLVVPNSALWSLVGKLFPSGPEWYRWIVKAIFWPVVGIHSAEVFWFDRTRLVRNGVPRGSLLWWLWSVNCWIEGATAWQRIDRLIAKKKEQKRLKKH